MQDGALEDEGDKGDGAAAAKALLSRQDSATTSGPAVPDAEEDEALDQFGCSAQEAAELDAYKRVMLQHAMSADEAVWQWCVPQEGEGGDEDDDGANEIKPERLRKMWEFMLDAASKCLKADEQSTFLQIVSVLLEVRRALSCCVRGFCLLLVLIWLQTLIADIQNYDPKLDFWMVQSNK